MMDHQACLVCQEKWVQEDFQVQEVLVVCLDLLAYLELRAAKEQRAMRVLLVHQDHLDKLVAKDLLDHPVQLVLWVHQDKQVQEENLVCLDYQDRMEFLETQEILDNLVPKVTLVLLAMLVLLGSLDPVVLKGTMVREEQPESLVRRVKEAMRVSRGIWVKRVTVDLPVHWVKQENLDLKEPKAVKDQGVKLGLLDLQDFQDILEDLETRVTRDNKEVTVFLVLKANE